MKSNLFTQLLLDIVFIAALIINYAVIFIIIGSNLLCIKIQQFFL